MKQVWYVYMVETRSGLLYTGVSTDVERRFREHCAGGARGAKFFRRDPAKRLVWFEPCGDRSAASKRESQIKKLSRESKLKLIQSSNSSSRSGETPQGSCSSAG